MLSGIEEESDIYEAFAPHVDFTNIPLSTESSPGKRTSICSVSGWVIIKQCSGLFSSKYLPGIQRIMGSRVIEIITSVFNKVVSETLSVAI